MCGIAGRICLEGQELDVAPLADMMDVVHYRGPDAQGFTLLGLDHRPARTGQDSQQLRTTEWRGVNIAFGHRRLAIIDPSEDANQPMSYDQQRLWLVFNGAIYNYVELRQELAEAGLPFATRSDTEVILAAYSHWGTECVQHFNGMFSIAIFDCARKRLVCFRDRLGIKPFYYAIHNGVFAFASEIKQLLAGGLPGKVNPRLAFDYLIVGSTDHQPETCFAGVQQLQPSHQLILQFSEDRRHAQPEISRYWQPVRRESLQRLPFEEAAVQVFDLLKDSVALRMRCDVPFGSCLSGGLDSSSVVALMAGIGQQQSAEFAQHTFTYQPEEPELDESRYALMLAERLGAKSHITRVEPNSMMEMLDEHLWHEEEPIGDLSHFARARVMATARQAGVTVMLDGQGGDELFLGYERYYVPAFLRFVREQGIRKASREFWLATRHSKLGPTKLLLYAFVFGSPWIRAAIYRRRARDWINPKFVDQYSVLDVAQRHHLGLDTWEMQRRDMLEIQLPHLLRHEDRDAMASSIEARTPFLDHRLVEFVMSLPLHTKIHEGWTKYVLRRAMQAHLPPEIVWRRDKLGFAVPQAQWVRRLIDYARQELTGEMASEKFVDPGKLRRCLQNHRIDTKTLWRIMSLEKTMRLFALQS